MEGRVKGRWGRVEGRVKGRWVEGGGERKGRGNEREKGGRKIVGEIGKWGKRREGGEILCSQVYLAMHA